MHSITIKRIIQLLFSGILLIYSISAQARVTIEGSNIVDCAANCSSTSCGELGAFGNPASARLILLSIIALMLSIFFYKKNEKKIYLAGGITASLIFLALFFIVPTQGKNPEDCLVQINKNVGVISKTASTSEFLAPSDEFESGAPKDSIKNQITISKSDSTSKTLALAETKDEFAPVTDEFSPASGEFTALDSTALDSGIETLYNNSKLDTETNYSLLYQLAVLFTLLILISFLIKYENFRKTKGLFLMVSVVYLGFFKGACPCMISSFQNTILAAMGSGVDWISMVWFLGLIPLTYFFGKVWCGWLCHLGGLQEFLFQSPKLNILKKQKTQNILRFIRIGFLAVLVIQLFITRTNIFIHYDPFKVAFILFSANLTGYILLVPMLISSVLIYRPFCRTVCPIGLILGWIALIPGARQLSKNDSCVDCISCSKSCQSKAMTYEHKKSVLIVQDCILCGDCMGSCKKKSLYVVNLKK